MSIVHPGTMHQAVSGAVPSGEALAPNRRHGGPYDRGSADSYYRRPFSPHYWSEGSYQGEKITELTAGELAAYRAGWAANEAIGDHKDWG